MAAPECPVCVQPMTVPIFQCQSGHSLCNSCTIKLMPPICPKCQQAMTQMRNWQLEELVPKNIVPCPNKSKGCVYNIAAKDIKDHVEECIFKEMVCPLAKVYGICSWSGTLQKLLIHFKESHPQNCTNNMSVVTINNISLTNDCHHFYILQNHKKIFFLTFKIDSVQKLAYWLVQSVSTKKVSRQSVYEIQMANKDHKQQVTYVDYCFSDSIDANEVFHEAKCAVMPLIMMSHFVVGSKITFKCSIKHVSEGKNDQTGSTKNDQTTNSKRVQEKRHPRGRELTATTQVGKPT